jgi:histidyl-tRNA synthetase
LCDECHSHFKEVLEFLDEGEIPYSLNPSLVRGLDYYTKTVFEIFSQNDQLAIGGGGRYDKLVKLLGGKETCAVGGGFGVERIVSLMKAQEIEIKDRKEIQVFLAQLGDLAKKKSLKLLEEFRKSKIGIAESFGRDSLKAQLNRANKLGARYALILGQKEALEGVIIMRDMENGKQSVVKLEEVVKEIRKKIKK